MTSSTARAPSSSLKTLAFGLFAGPVMWSIQELVSYSLAAQACYPGSAPLREPLIGGVGVFVALTTLVALVIAIAALLVSLRSWRAAGSVSELEAPDESRIRFLSLAGILVSALFILAIALNGVPVLLLSPCD